MMTNQEPSSKSTFSKVKASMGAPGKWGHLHQEDLLPLFVHTNNAGQVAAEINRIGANTTLGELGERLSEAYKRTDQAPTKHQQGVQALVITHLKQHGGIDALTVQKLGTTDARKIFTRLREKGYLFPADDVNGHDVRPNASGQGTYRWHRWTGKQ